MNIGARPSMLKGELVKMRVGARPSVLKGELAKVSYRAHGAVAGVATWPELV